MKGKSELFDLFIELSMKVNLLGEIIEISEEISEKTIPNKMKEEIIKITEDVKKELKKYESLKYECVKSIVEHIQKEMEKLTTPESILHYSKWEEIDSLFFKLQMIKEVDDELSSIKEEVKEIEMWARQTPYECFEKIFRSFFREATKILEREEFPENYQSKLKKVKELIKYAKKSSHMERMLVDEEQSGTEVYARCIDAMISQICGILNSERISKYEKIEIVEKICKHLIPKLRFLKEGKLPKTGSGKVLHIIPKSFYEFLSKLERFHRPEYVRLIEEIENDVRSIKEKLEEGKSPEVCLLTRDKIREVTSVIMKYTKKHLGDLEVDYRDDKGKLTPLGSLLVRISVVPIGKSEFDYVPFEYGSSQSKVFDVDEMKKQIKAIHNLLHELKASIGIKKLDLLRDVLESYKDLKIKLCPTTIKLPQEEEKIYIGCKEKGKFPQEWLYLTIIDFIKYVVESGIITLAYDERGGKNILQKYGITSDISIKFFKEICEILVS